MHTELIATSAVKDSLQTQVLLLPSSTDNIVADESEVRLGISGRDGLCTISFDSRVLASPTPYRHQSAPLQPQDFPERVMAF